MGLSAWILRRAARQQRYSIRPAASLGGMTGVLEHCQRGLLERIPWSESRRSLLLGAASSQVCSDVAGRQAPGSVFVWTGGREVASAPDKGAAWTEVADLTGLPPGRDFTLVLGFWPETLERLEEFFDCANRVLAPGGYFGCIALSGKSPFPGQWILREVVRRERRLRLSSRGTGLPGSEKSLRRLLAWRRFRDVRTWVDGVHVESDSAEELYGRMVELAGGEPFDANVRPELLRAAIEESFLGIARRTFFPDESARTIFLTYEFLGALAKLEAASAP